MRILLPRGEQKKLMESVLFKISVAKASEICNLSERTIRDWRREKFLMQKDAMLKLCKKTNILIPKNFEEKDDYWYVALGSSKGALACIKKYGRVGGDPENRKKKWYEWWNKKGKFIDNPLFKTKPINKPCKSKELAEFIGIMLGDGGITSKGRQIQITLNDVDDKEYIQFVYKLIYKLFNRQPSIYKCKDSRASRISLSSVELVNFLVELGIKNGNKIKLKADIPIWIKANKMYSIACTRGLIDTDGCIFNHRYKVKNQYYNYKKLSFTNYSQPIRKSVYDTLGLLGIKSRLFSYRDVRIDSQNNMKKYFEIIGSHNPKHLKRYYK